MQLQRPLAAVILGAALTSCGINPGPAEEGALASQAQATFAPPSATEEAVTEVSHVVPDTSCPEGWTGLEVTTDGDGDVGDLDDVVACTDSRSQRTYLENRSRVVWLLSAATVTPSLAVRVRPGPSETSFLRIVRETHGQEAMAPGSVMTANVPPDQVTWTPDLPLTFGWEAHALTATGLQTRGPSFTLAALRRQNAGGAALRACTLAAEQTASSVAGLPRADAGKVLLAGLGSARCRSAAARAGVPNPGSQVTSGTQRWQAVTGSLDVAADTSLALPDGAQLLAR